MHSGMLSVMGTTDNQKRRRAERTRVFLQALCEHFPQCFTADRGAVRPLAIGIQATLKTAISEHETLAETPAWLIRQALARYTGSPAYLQAIIDGKPRINLQGETVEAVSPEAIAAAKERRTQQKAAAEARRKAQAEAAAAERRAAKLNRLAEHFNNKD